MAPNLLNQWRGNYLNHSLKGVSLVTFMLCSVEWVQPNSAGSNENTSWYSTRSQCAASTSSGDQESSLLKSNSSKQFTTSLPNCQPRGVGIMGLIGPPPAIAHPQGVQDTGNAATALATRVFFWRACKYAVLFCTTRTAFLLPFLNLVYMFCTVRPCGKEPS